MIKGLWRLFAVAAATLGLAGPAMASQLSVDLWAVGEAADGAWLGAVDAGTIRRQGDITTFDAVTVYRAAGEEGGDYMVAQHRIDCAARRVQVLTYAFHALDGRIVSTGRGTEGMLPIGANTLASAEFGFVCEGDRDSQQWEGVTIGQVAVEARLYWRQGKAEGATWTDYWLIAGAAEEYYLIDMASLRRDGDKAWVKVIAVRHAAGADGFDYLVAEDYFECAAALVKGVAAAGYDVTGRRVGEVTIQEQGLAPVADNAFARLEYDLACKGGHDIGFHAGGASAVAVTAGMRRNWDNLYRP